MTEPASHAQVVQSQFGGQAGAYLHSAVHVQGAEFAQLQEAVTAQPQARVLDLRSSARRSARCNRAWARR